ncbi:DUF6233 domain-containing protein [Streptomyces sp. NPDC052107]|uniref:DUF6233 domain-containing protein n=1 Tax=Streptomyces sp. NPDC052107 TaxID=3155632 RepID=UPI00341FDE10
MPLHQLRNPGQRPEGERTLWPPARSLSAAQGNSWDVAHCPMTQRSTRPVSASDAREALAKDGEFFRACEYCRPDTKLGILD